MLSEVHQLEFAALALNAGAPEMKISQKSEYDTRSQGLCFMILIRCKPFCDSRKADN